MTHLYTFFGALLQCSQYSKPDFGNYTGQASMYEVHKFMALGSAEVTYFITQVALAAASFGVAESDIAAVGTALTGLFAKRCAPAVQVIPPQESALQSICTEPDCPIADNAVCGMYDNVIEPMNATTTMSGSSTMSMTSSGAAITMTLTTTDASGSVMTKTSTGMATGTAATTVPTAGAAAAGWSLMAVAGGIAALML